MSLDQDGVINEVALVDETSVLSQQGQPPRVNHTRNEPAGRGHQRLAEAR